MNHLMIKANDYQKDAWRFSNKDLTSQDEFGMAALGLTGEAGEVADHIKKYLYHNHALDKDKVAKELGDVLWYVAAMCTILDITMSQVMAGNIRKLSDRYGAKFSSEASINRKPTDE